jgi:hypothetical protein
MLREWTFLPFCARIAEISPLRGDMQKTPY